MIVFIIILCFVIFALAGYMNDLQDEIKRQDRIIDVQSAEITRHKETIRNLKKEEKDAK